MIKSPDFKKKFSKFWVKFAWLWVNCLTLCRISSNLIKICLRLWKISSNLTEIQLILRESSNWNKFSKKNKKKFLFVTSQHSRIDHVLLCGSIMCFVHPPKTIKGAYKEILMSQLSLDDLFFAIVLFEDRKKVFKAEQNLSGKWVLSNFLAGIFKPIFGLKILSKNCSKIIFALEFV